MLVSLWAIFLTYTFVILLGEALVLPAGSWCPYLGVTKSYPNPDSAPGHVCYYYRTPYLLGLNPFECDFGRRVIASLIFGSCIGYERKAADRPAGVRTSKTFGRNFQPAVYSTRFCVEERMEYHANTRRRRLSLRTS